eukprot:g27354.t1
MPRASLKSHHLARVRFGGELLAPVPALRRVPWARRAIRHRWHLLRMPVRLRSSDPQFQIISICLSICKMVEVVKIIDTL